MTNQMEALSKKTNYEPRCYFKKCRNADCQYDGIWDWIEFMLVLKNSRMIQNAQLGSVLLDWAEARDSQTLALLIELDRYHETLINAKIEQRRDELKR